MCAAGVVLAAVAPVGAAPRAVLRGVLPAVHAAGDAVQERLHGVEMLCDMQDFSLGVLRLWVCTRGKSKGV